MTTTQSKTAALVAGTAYLTHQANAAEVSAVAEFLTKIKSLDDQIRGPAWQNAGPVGAAAVKPLAEIMNSPDMEIARAAKRALWQIVRYAGRPGAKKDASAVVGELLLLLGSAPVVVRRETLWMLSEIAGDTVVDRMAALLSDPALREDARCALIRLPGAKVTRALKKAFNNAPEDFKPALAHSLRLRGEKVDGYPSQKLVPVKKTAVEPKRD
jgi:hypothetical protein